MNEQKQLKNSRDSNTKIIIDPGHGGFDPGGGSNEVFKEKDINMKISNYQKKRFDELGIPSYLVRTNDETLNPTERLNKVASLGADDNDILISNHINTGNSNGGEVIYSIRGTKNLPNKIATELKNTGLPIRNVYTRLGRTGQDFYFILRGTKPNNAMIVEYGFASDKNDTNRILYHWNDLAEAVVKAISNYLSVPYTPPKETLYIVEPNDSLYKIAKKYNTSVDKIKQLNNLSSDEILPGMSLIISNE